MRLLLIEDNKELVDLTARGLSKAGFDVDNASTVSAAREALVARNYAAVILDLGLPDGDGYAVLNSMRARGDSTPVLILTARGSVQDRVTELGTGADDYLVKPFALDELIARVQALLRRPSQYIGKPIVAGNLAFDATGRQLFVDGNPQALSAREMALFELLIRRLGRVVPKATAEMQLFGQADDLKSNAIEVYVHRLRKQLSDVGATVEIHTVRGIGYLMIQGKQS